MDEDAYIALLNLYAAIQNTPMPVESRKAMLEHYRAVKKAFDQVRSGK